MPDSIRPVREPTERSSCFSDGFVAGVVTCWFIYCAIYIAQALL